MLCFKHSDSGLHREAAEAPTHGALDKTPEASS